MAAAGDGGVPVQVSQSRTRRLEGPMDRRGDGGLRGRLRNPRSKRQREAVLAWLIEGAVKWYQNGQEMPDPPAVVEAAKETWRTQVDVLLRYMAEELVPDPELSHRGREHLSALRASGSRPTATPCGPTRRSPHGSATTHGCRPRASPRSRYGRRRKGKHGRIAMCGLTGRSSKRIRPGIGRGSVCGSAIQPTFSAPTTQMGGDLRWMPEVARGGMGCPVSPYRSPSYGRSSYNPVPPRATSPPATFPANPQSHFFEE